MWVQTANRGQGRREARFCGLQSTTHQRIQLWAFLFCFLQPFVGFFVCFFTTIYGLLVGHSSDKFLRGRKAGWCVPSSMGSGVSFYWVHNKLVPIYTYMQKNIVGFRYGCTLAPPAMERHQQIYATAATIAGASTGREKKQCSNSREQQQTTSSSSSAATAAHR